MAVGTQDLVGVLSAPVPRLETETTSEARRGWRKTQTAPILGTQPAPIPRQRARRWGPETASESREGGGCWKAPMGAARSGETLTASHHGRHRLCLRRKQNQTLPTRHDSYPPSKILILAGSPRLEAGASSSGFPRFSSSFCTLARSFWPSGETSEGR